MMLPAPTYLQPYSSLWLRYPLTWTLTILNVLVFVLIFNGNTENYSTQKILQAGSIEITGRLYYQYLNKLPPQELAQKPSWIHQLHANDLEQMETLGAFALRDADFLAKSEKLTFQGDTVRISQWKQDLVEFKTYYFQQIIFLFGLHSFKGSPLSWITYQFSHSGWVHLCSNLVFLVVMGLAVEAIAGSSILILVYLFGGLAGGLAFLLLNSHGAVPMIGASASVSALLAFYCVIETRKRIRFLFFISPLDGQNGFIFLPTILIFPLFLLVDFGSLIATPEGFASGVAYSAHIGGTLFGLTLGAVYRFWPRSAAISKS